MSSVAAGVMRKITNWLGSVTAVALSIVLVVAWAAAGPFFKYSQAWQIFINTTTTVITFWMVFAIQNTQNRDMEGLQAKLDELISATSGARDGGIGIEKRDADDIEEWRRDPARDEENG